VNLAEKESGSPGFPESGPPPAWEQLPASGGPAMRAIIINAKDRTITATEIDGSLKSLQRIVGGLIEPVYDGLGDAHHCYVNDEGLFDHPQHFFFFRNGHQPLAGNGVILSSTEDGDEAPCTLLLDWVKDRVTFMDLAAAREWSRSH
jgi:hypothetical protein